MTPGAIKIEQTGAKELERCECCGNVTRRVWGFAHRGKSTEAAYFVEWTAGAVAHHGAYFDFIFGPWGEESFSKDRVAVSLAFRRTTEGPQFMVVDASQRPVAASDLVGRALESQEVVDTPLAKQTFEIVDAVWLQDDRLAEVTGDAA